MISFFKSIPALIRLIVALAAECKRVESEWKFHAYVDAMTLKVKASTVTKDSTDVENLVNGTSIKP